MSEDSRTGSSAFFEDELDAFKFRNEMRKRPDYVVKYPDIVGLTSDEFYDRIRQDNETLSSSAIPTVEVESEQSEVETIQPSSRLTKLKGLFTSPDAS